MDVLMNFMNVFLAISLVVTLQFVAWVIYYFMKNPSIVDVFWGLTACSLSSFYLWPAQGLSSKISLFLIVVWALRLSGYLFWTRIVTHKVDTRYLSLASQDLNQNWYFFKNFQLQGILLLILTLPFVFIDGGSQYLSFLKITATLLICSGLVIEAIADWQLLQFKLTQGGTSLMQVGLWSKSRHPNYFGEILIWVGFALFAFDPLYLWSLSAFLSPLLLWAVMYFITIPLTEVQALIKRPEAYALYRSKVPMIVPTLFH